MCGPRACACSKHVRTFERLGCTSLKHSYINTDMRARSDASRTVAGALADASGTMFMHYVGPWTGDGGGSSSDAWWAAAADDDELVDVPRRIERLDVTYARASKQVPGAAAGSRPTHHPSASWPPVILCMLLA